MKIHVNIQDLLNKATDTNTDLDVIHNKLSNFAKNFSASNNSVLILQRIGFKKDFAIADNMLRQTYMELIKKSYQKWGYFTKNTLYRTSAEFTNKSRKIIVYDKNKERRNKHRFPKTYAQDVLMIEVQLKRRYISKRRDTRGFIYEK